MRETCENRCEGMTCPQACAAAFIALHLWSSLPGLHAVWCGARGASRQGSAACRIPAQLLTPCTHAQQTFAGQPLNLMHGGRCAPLPPPPSIFAPGCSLMLVGKGGKYDDTYDTHDAHGTHGTQRASARSTPRHRQGEAAADRCSAHSQEGAPVCLQRGGLAGARGCSCMAAGKLTARSSRQEK